MELDNYKLRTLDSKMTEFKKYYDQFYVYLHDMSFDHRLLEGERELLLDSIRKLEAQKLDSETKVRQALDAADTIRATAKEEAQKIRADNMVLYTSCKSRYESINEILDDAEKKRIKQHLAGMEKAGL